VQHRPAAADAPIGRMKSSDARRAMRIGNKNRLLRPLHATTSAGNRSSGPSAAFGGHRTAEPPDREVGGHRSCYGLFTESAAERKAKLWAYRVMSL
jgi:hypothetical protein